MSNNINLLTKFKYWNYYWKYLCLPEIKSNNNKITETCILKMATG